MFTIQNINKLFFSFGHEQIIDEYESIDKRVNDLLRYLIILFFF